MHLRFDTLRRVFAQGIPFCILPFAFCLPGCTEQDPEEPGIEKPVITGVVTGDIKTRREYADAVESANKRNAERGDRRDWRYAKPAVGPAE